MTTPIRSERASTVPARAYRYYVAFGAMTVAVVATAVLQDAGAETFSPLVGAVAIACWYGGVGPGAVSILFGFTTAWFTGLGSGSTWDSPTHADVYRWLSTLVVSLIVLWVSWALTRVGRQATARAESAERERSITESVQHLATELSSALTPSDVAHALVERLPGLLGAAGAALGLIEGDRLRIVDPAGAPRQTLPPGSELELTAPIPLAVAARTGEIAMATTRESLERDFPAGARLVPKAQGALAVPLRLGGEVVGSMGFPFEAHDAIDDEVVSFALLAADLGSQALERAGLYEQERLARETLDRISRLAPRFGSESPEAVLRAVCREATETFEADVAQIWEIERDSFHVLWREPENDVVRPGTRVPLADFPDRAESIRRLETLFIEDSWVALRGAALGHAKAFGIRSSLRVPIAVGGSAGRVLVLQWTRIVPEPSPSATLLARRFADQAGLALSHAERRVAQDAAARNAEETRRLLDVTGALAAALEPAAVAEASLREAFRGLGASSGVVFRLSGEHDLELVAALGYPAEALEGWDRFELDADLPLGDAVRRNSIVVLESLEARERRYPAMGVATENEALIALPLVAGGRVVGGLALSFVSARVFSDADREFALALSRQAGQALERSMLLETEHDARMRAERMASDLARLHALATSLGAAGLARDVARIIGEQMIQGIDAGSAGIYALSRDREQLTLLSIIGRLGMEDMAHLSELSVGEARPVAEAVRSNSSVWLLDEEDWAAYPTALAARPPGVTGLGIVPLVVQQTSIGALFVLFDGARVPTVEDRRFAETVARQAAQPLERVRLLEEERASRLRAERANLQIQRLQSVTESLSSALTPGEVVEVFLTQAASAVGASAVTIGLVDESGAVAEPGWEGASGGVPEAWLESHPQAQTPVRDAIVTRRPLYFDSVDAVVSAYAELDAPAGDERQHSFAFVPLLAGRRPFAATVLTWAREAFLDDEDRAFIEALSSQCAQALDRAQRYETERTIAETLQRSVLPETLPSMEGATVAARYLPGTAAIDVGGDWFDTIALADGRLGFVVGDVVGKGVQAAATMAQLRNGMRALTLDSSDPAAIVTKLNRLLDGVTDSPFATLAFVVVDPVTYAVELLSAGHLPPLVLSPDREPRLLEGTRGLPLGVEPDTRYETWTTTLEPGSTIVLYTDGLVERRDRSLDEGLRLLEEAVRGVGAAPEELVDTIIERLIGSGDRGDDTAVLAVALDRAPLGAYSVRLPSDRDSLVELRHSFARWLERSGIAEADSRDLMLATWEASANAIEHAQGPTEPVIEVEATLTGDRVRVEVLDTGSWSEPRERPDRGLGLHLIQALMTSLTVQQDSGGTRVVMERALSRERAGDARAGEGGANGASGAHAADDRRV